MSPTLKSGLLFGVISFLANLALGVFIAICTPICGVVWGAAAGVAVIAWSGDDNAVTSPAQSGGTAGAIAGIGALLGLFIGLLLQFTALGGQQTATELSRQLNDQFGLPSATSDLAPVWQWIGFISMSCCLGIINIAVLAGAGSIAARLFASRNETQTG